MSAQVSILIPTRNRPLLARLAVEAALEGSDEACEVVVADNGDTVLELPAHPRLRHLRPLERPLGMPDNWERALQAAGGEWLMLLSDKYMLVPGAVRSLRELAAERSARVVTYGSGVLRQGLAESEASQEALLRGAGGELQVPAPTELREVSSRSTLEEMYRQAGRYAPRAPMLYTALVHRSVSAAASARRGRFFFGPCPDVASALQILSTIERYLQTSLPAIMIQYPSVSSEWSTGLSTVVRGEVARCFFRDLGGGPRRASERLVSSLIFDTLRALPEQPSSTRLSWSSYAWEASREIGGHPWLRRPILHGDLLGRTWSGGGMAAAWVQLRAAVGYHLPGALGRLLLRVRSHVLRASGGEGQRPEGIERISVQGRADALEYLARLVREPAPPPRGTQAHVP